MTSRERLFFVGSITRPHGLRGEVKVLEGEGSSGAWRQATELWLGRDPDSAQPHRVRSVRGGGRFAILALEGVDDLEAAERLRQLQVFVRPAALPELEAEAFYAGELLGFRVECADGRQIGTLREIFDNGAHEVYAVAAGRREILLPVVDGVVLEVDRDSGRIVVAPPPGLPGLDD